MGNHFIPVVIIGDESSELHILDHNFFYPGAEGQNSSMESHRRFAINNNIFLFGDEVILNTLHQSKEGGFSGIWNVGEYRCSLSRS